MVNSRVMGRSLSRKKSKLKVAANANSDNSGESASIDAGSMAASGRWSFEAPADFGDSGRQLSGRFPAVVWLLLIAALALLLRLANVYQTSTLPTVISPLGDSRGYLQWAEQIVGGQWYGTEPFYQAPAYPYFLAVLKSLFGDSVNAIRVCQSLLGSVSVLLIGLATQRMFGARCGVAAALALALYPPAIFYDGLVQKAALASFLLCALLYLISLANLGRRQMIAAAACGACLGLLCLTRENALIWLPILVLWFLLSTDKTTTEPGAVVRPQVNWRTMMPNRRSIQKALAFVAGLVVVFLPVVVRNGLLGGVWSPTTFQAGSNFYIGNNANATGIYQPLISGRETPLYERSDAIQLAEQLAGRELTASEVSQFWFDKAFAEIGQDPANWMRLLASKSLMVVNDFEVPDVDSYQLFSQFSLVLMMLSPIWNFGWLFALALIGILVTRTRWHSLWWYYLLTLAMLAAIVGFFLLGRYRQPLAVLLIPMAAIGVVTLIDAIKENRWRPLVAAALIMTAGILIGMLPVYDRQAMHASAWMNAGIAAGRLQDYPQSIRYFESALQMNADLPEAHFNLGRALQLSGRPDLALQSYRKSLQLNPDLIDAYVPLAEVLEQMGQFADAVVVYEEALNVNPLDSRAKAALSRLKALPNTP